ncbi:hypothetical protein PIGHUM_00261 [Pigmentiphaga humi]|uniref:DUF985 domain-containing protein n=1 Tax=Pigmentiphaga humi TaxID=2478468 RepID=A0A3P4AXF1_9BURK|nr:cupin domain-containing protein [Pigmentiphaga humi]VCU68211.1 hypothetical protein PIGHUM_00261 [Pigmentiphaga humi]
MHPRAQALITQLGLQPHPEGGYYGEVFRSGRQVLRQPDGLARSALTSIFFLLPRGATSCWHRVAHADEAWHHYEGAPVALHVLLPGAAQAEAWLLGPIGDAHPGALPARVVPADAWQAARPLGDYALVGCTVGPGFDFADFAMARDLSAGERPAALDPALL